MKNRKKQSKAATQPNAAPPKPVGSLQEIQRLVESPIHIECDYEGKVFLIEARKLRPNEMAVIDEIVDSVVPPMISIGKSGEDLRPNESDPEFVRKKARAQIEARAYAVYWACPIFQAERPKLDGKELVEFVQSKLTDTILSAIYRAVTRGGTELAALVNFTSTGTSLKS